jgi:hypothetical protein
MFNNFDRQGRINSHDLPGGMETVVDCIKVMFPCVHVTSVTYGSKVIVVSFGRGLGGKINEQGGWQYTIGWLPQSQMDGSMNAATPVPKVSFPAQ